MYLCKNCVFQTKNDFNLKKCPICKSTEAEIIPNGILISKKAFEKITNLND